MTIEYKDSKRISALAYELNAYTTESAYDTTGVTYGAESPLSTSQIRRGIKILSGSSAIGKIIRKVSTKFRGTSSPTGSLYFKVYRSGSAISTSEALDVSTLTTSFVLKELTLDTKVTLEADDRVVAEYTDATGSMTVHFLYNNNPSTIASGFEHTSWNGSAWSDINYDLMFAFDSTPASYTNPTGDVKPTNVQDNSILVETDTARRYWFETATAPTYSGDLGTWETDGTQVTESSDVVTMNIQTRSTNQAVTNDLGANLSDSAWVMRCKLILSTITGGSGSTVYLELGVGSASASTAFANGGITQDFIGLQQRKASDADGWGLVGYNSTGGLDNPESPLMDANPTTRTYYVEIKRLSTTSMSIGLYDSADYNTLISGLPLETKTDVPSGVTGLRYIRVGNGMVSSESSTGNVIAGTVQDIEIYNGVTSVTPDTWTRQPPSFTASFWGAGGTAGPWTPVNYHDEFNGSTWSSATALGTSVEMVSGCGTKTAGLVIGGDIGGTNQPISTVQEWNGSAWSTSTGGTLNIVRNQHASGGINTSAWAQGGTTGSMGQVTSSSFWNDTSWTSGGVTSVGRRNHGGAGSTDDCWITGGYDGSNSLASTEQYNGTSWSAGGNLSVAVNSIMGGGGDTYNAIITGGYDGSNNSNRSNIYNGTAWSLGGTLSNAHRYGITSGTPDDAIAGLGYVSSWTPTWAELYNGTTWSTTGSVGSGRTTGAGGN